jgi:uncharacterized iron-regulated membrane protein
MTQDTNDPERGFKGGLRQSMSWLHTWAGLVLSVLLYFMFVTGSVGYFTDEVGRWMAEQAIGFLQQRMPEAKAWYIDFPQGRRAGLGVYSEPQPGPDGKEAEALDEKLDPATGQPYAKARKTGGGRALYAMHYELRYIPYDVAIYIVGIATMFMLVAIVSGIVVHKKIFKDFFTFRPAKGQRSWLDAHNVSSVMALPFLLMITYSGLIFYTYEYMPSVKLALYGSGEQAEKRFDAEAFGGGYAEPEASGVKAPLAPLAPMLREADARWGSGAVAYLSIDLPGDANARVRMQRYERATISRDNETLVFNGITGALLSLPAQTKSAAGTFSNVMLALHEGHFANAVLRWLYFTTGLLGAAMIATGMVLWTSKRRQKLGEQGVADIGLRFVERLNVGSIVGLPVGIAAYFWANRLIPAAVEGRAAWEMHTLFIAWALCLLHSGLRPVRRAWVEQLALAVLLYALLPLLNALTTDVHLGRTWPLGGQAGDWVLAGFDLTMLALALCFGWAWRKAMAKQRRAAQAQAEQAQAEPSPSLAAGGEHLA